MAVTLAEGEAYYRSPFSMSGRLLGYTPTELVAPPPADLALWGVPLFDLEIRGNGRATLRMTEVDGRQGFVALSYDFTPRRYRSRARSCWLAAGWRSPWDDG